MRSDQEIMDLILHRAQSDPRILAAYLKGSRANPNAPKDIYRDFDVVYVVTETESFRSDPSWLEDFGPVLFKQEQDDAFGYGARFGIQRNYQDGYSWLLLFADGSRIDMGVETRQAMERDAWRNKLFLPLLDKAGCLPHLPPPSDEDFHVRPPDERDFRGCCKEFFWCLCDAEKGIARDELPFAMTTYNTLARPMLEQMLCWYIGVKTDFSLSCGKHNKYFKRLLPQEDYRAYVRTYTDGDYARFRQAIDAARALFRQTACQVGAALGLPYPREDEEGCARYLDWIRNTRVPKGWGQQQKAPSRSLKRPGRSFFCPSGDTAPSGRCFGPGAWFLYQGTRPLKPGGGSCGTRP